VGHLFLLTVYLKGIYSLTISKRAKDPYETGTMGDARRRIPWVQREMTSRMEERSSRRGFLIEGGCVQRRQPPEEWNPAWNTSKNDIIGVALEP
jgi:hypothetical protein